MRYLGRLKISTSLYVLFGISAALLSGEALRSVVGAFDQQHEAAQVRALASANRDLFAALEMLRPERGPTRIALEATNPADPQFIATLPPLRAKAAPGLDALLAACSRITCAEGDAVGDIRTALRKVVAIRPKVDAALALPLAQRPAGIAKDWNDASTGLIDELERVSLALTNKVRMADPATAELMAIKDASYVVRSAAGLERNPITAAIAAKAFTPERKSKVAELRGQVDAGWHLVRNFTSRKTTPQSVLAAVDAADQAYFRSYLKQQQAVEKALADGAALPLSETEFVKASNAALDALVAIPSAALDATVRHAEAQYAEARMNLLFESMLLLVSLILAAAGFFVAWRRVARPVDLISAAMRRVASGELAAEVPFLERRDEVGTLAGALMTFKDNAVAKQRIEAEQAAERTAKEARAQRLEERMRAFEAQIGRLVQSLAAASTQMERTAQSLAATAEESTRRAEIVGTASAETSANVQTVATATQELSSSSQEIGRQVAQSAAVAGRAVNEAKRSDAAVQRLAEGAQKIGEVIGLIQSIASQTNLLALNATIEAARAGEAGKGFAVVANEVKSLATQTAKATEEITDQIAQVQGATSETVEALQGINAIIAEISQIATTIAGAIEEQGVATQEIARNVQQAASGTQEVASNIERVKQAATDTGAAATHVLGAAQQLSKQTEELSAEVEGFLAGVKSA
jgi:methyl-accepting chemotaxis protein